RAPASSATNQSLRQLGGHMEQPPKPRPTVVGRERDQIFAQPERPIRDFDFGGETAAVFDDMLERSVPFYPEIQRMVSELAVDFAAEGSAIYDFGCSTCTDRKSVVEGKSVDLGG